MSRDEPDREAQPIDDRSDPAPEDAPMRRESDHLVREEFRRLADELRASWIGLSIPPAPRRHEE